MSLVHFAFFLAVWTPLTEGMNVKNSVQADFQQLEGFSITVFEYTSVGWDYDYINESIIDDNLVVLETVSQPTNVSAVDHIMLFPEFTLTTHQVTYDRKLATTLAQRVPAAGSPLIPCVEGSFDPDDMVVTKISCIARNRFAYMVVGLLEKVPCVDGEECNEDGWKIYSTTVVFDKNGYLIVKYQKARLIDEPALDKASEVAKVTFTTDNGITFGLLTGQDLLYAEPLRSFYSQGITHFLSTGAWKSQMPFGYSTSIQFGWSKSSYGAGYFLAAANYLRPELGYSGYGIYYPSDFPDMGYGVASGDYVAITVSAYGKTYRNHFDVDREESRAVIIEGIDFYEFESEYVPVDFYEINTVQVCYGYDFCCSLTYQITEISFEKTPHYQLVAFDGNRTDSEGNVLFTEQICGLVACSSNDIMSCSASKDETDYTFNTKFMELTLVGSFSTSKVFPVTMDGDPYYFPVTGPLELSVQQRGSRYEAIYTYNGTTGIQIKAFALSSTDYLDYLEKNGSTVHVIAQLLLLASFLCVGVFK